MPLPAQHVRGVLSTSPLHCTELSVRGFMESVWRGCRRQRQGLCDRAAAQERVALMCLGVRDCRVAVLRCTLAVCSELGQPGRAHQHGSLRHPPLTHALARSAALARLTGCRWSPLTASQVLRLVGSPAGPGENCAAHSGTAAAAAPPGGVKRGSCAAAHAAVARCTRRWLLQTMQTKKQTCVVAGM